MKFVQFTVGHEGGSVWINPEQVCAVASNSGSTEITLSNGPTVVVVEGAQYVLKALLGE